MGSRDRYTPALVKVEHNPVKIAGLDILTTTLPISKYHGETPAGQNSAERSMIPEPRSGQSTKIDSPRWYNSNILGYILMGTAIIEWVFVVLLLVVP